MPNQRSEDKAKLTCWLDRDVIDALKEHAETTGQSVTDLMNQMLLKYMPKLTAKKMRGNPKS